MTEKQYERISSMIIKEQNKEQLYNLMKETGEHLRQLGVMVSIKTPW